MTTYLVHSTGLQHEIEATTYVQDSNGLRFVGVDGVTVAQFFTVDWVRIKPVAEPVAEPAV